MKRILSFILTMTFLLTGWSALHVQAQDFSGAEKLGWKVGSQAYTFRMFTLEETLDKLNKIGIKYVELYGNQPIGAGIDGDTSYKMSPEKRKQLKELLQSKGITPVAFGVSSGNNETEWRQLFEFAKDMGIGILTSEPVYDHLDLVESLCKEFNIKVAIHNHPIPSKYWHPDIIMNLLDGRSELMGVCADLGHWLRSGLDPIESLRKIEGRLISFHFKDLNEFGVRRAHDVHWGTGLSNISGVMNEMKRQGFQGPISVEYEYNWENSLPDVRASVEYFARVANALADR